MSQVRAPRTQQIAVPPAAPTALELSREEREQLRAVRHHAYQRYQRNASWMRELLTGETRRLTTDDGFSTLEISEESAIGSEDPALAQAKVDTAAVKQRMELQEQRFQEDQQRHSELLAALRSMDTDASLADCRTRVMEEASRHAQASKKELKTIKL